MQNLDLNLANFFPKNVIKNAIIIIVLVMDEWYMMLIHCDEIWNMKSSDFIVAGRPENGVFFKSWKIGGVMRYSW